MPNEEKNEIQAQQPKIELVRKFELAIYNEDITDEGKPRYKQVMFERPIIIEAKSQQELKEKLEVYKDSGQIAKVIREIDPPSKEQIAALTAQQKGEKTVNSLQNKNDETRQPTLKNAVENTEIVQTTKTKPKYYKVGDIEIKDDNGKIYQKQWMKLSESEASNIRVVNDKNNALVNLNGKHIEMKRWILIETSEPDDCTQLEENLK